MVTLTENACSPNSGAISNPYSKNAATPLLKFTYSDSQATNQVVTNQVANDTMGIQSQRREGAVKKCKKRGTKLLTKHKLRQHAINAGGVAFISIENCAVCKAANLNAKGIKTRIPKRAHHKACPKNLKTRGTSEMTVFVNKEAARNLAANRAAIPNTTVAKSQKEFSSSGFFAERTNQVTKTVRPSTSSTSTIATATTVSIADPSSLRRELDERIKKLESKGDDYNWLDKKGIHLLLD